MCIHLTNMYRKLATGQPWFQALYQYDLIESSLEVAFIISHLQRGRLEVQEMKELFPRSHS